MSGKWLRVVVDYPWQQLMGLMKDLRDLGVELFPCSEDRCHSSRMPGEQAEVVAQLLREVGLTRVTTQS